jgi:signal transduction histidine kinase
MLRHPALAVGERQYELMFTNMQNGFALHRVIQDAAGRPVDYEFLALNPAYTAMTGLAPETTIGRRVTQVVPGTERDPANWIGVFGEVALSGRTVRLEAYSEAIGKWFEVVAYGAEPLQFAVLIHEITDRKLLEAALLEASSREQERLGRELHDGLGQEITGIALLAEGIARDAERAGLPNAQEQKRLAATASHAIGTCRGLAHGMSPLDEVHGDLPAALRALAARQSGLHGPAVDFEEVGGAAIRLPRSSADHLYRIGQEAISNALRYAEATRIVIRLVVRSDSVRLEVEDDGCGCGPAPDQAAGIGIKTMRYRARVLGGDLAIGPGEHGGTRIACLCPQPVAAPAGEEQARSA